MEKITKYNKKIRITYIVSAFTLCLLMALCYPWIKSEENYGADGYYVAELNGVKLGAAHSEAEIKEAYQQARLQVSAQNSELTYMDPELKIYKQNKITGVRKSQEELQTAMYEVLQESIINTKTEAYMVNIDGFTVTLASREEVIQLFEAAKQKYDEKNQFAIDLIEEDKEYVALTSKIVKAEVEPNTADTVAAGAGDTPSQDKQETEDKKKNPLKQGISEIRFEENIEIIPCYVDDSQIVSLEDAIDQVTKDKEKNQIYVVQAGDCLSVIAAKFDLKLAELLAMNEGLQEDSFIGVGDELIVTVPEPELSVLVSKIKNYNETYDLPVEYVYNDSQYNTYEQVLNEGRSGKRNVTAKITYKDGTEIDREILEEKVKREAVARVIEVGTLTPPTFIKPISGGMFTSGFEWRWGTMHKGIDWACPIGTAVNASCAGTVVYAGWMSGYGYCVDIQHSDGKRTRYGHLSEVLVYNGQYVAQGEQVARSGNTGYSTGPHVHFEIMVGGVQVDPFTYLQ